LRKEREDTGLVEANSCNKDDLPIQKQQALRKRDTEGKKESAIGDAPGRSKGNVTHITRTSRSRIPCPYKGHKTCKYVRGEKSEVNPSSQNTEHAAW